MVLGPSGCPRGVRERWSRGPGVAAPDKRPRGPGVAAPNKWSRGPGVDAPERWSRGPCRRLCAAEGSLRQNHAFRHLSFHDRGQKPDFSPSGTPPLPCPRGTEQKAQNLGYDTPRNPAPLEPVHSLIAGLQLGPDPRPYCGQRRAFHTPHNARTRARATARTAHTARRSHHRNTRRRPASEPNRNRSPEATHVSTRFP